MHDHNVDNAKECAVCGPLLRELEELAEALSAPALEPIQDDSAEVAE